MPESEWDVGSKQQFKVRPEFVKKVHQEIEQYITLEEVDSALRKFANTVQDEQPRITAELEDHPLSVVFSVLERLSDCRRLNEASPIAGLVKPLIPDPLVVYLYLTCFDRLGQPVNWIEFGSWLKSSKHRKERDEILFDANEQDLRTAVGQIYAKYNAIYGMRSSFFNFLRNLLPPEIRRELLDSIERVTMWQVQDKKAQEATDREKEGYLVKRRNDYTHKAGFRPPAGEWLGGGFSSPDTEYEENSFTNTRTNGWPSVLEKTVRVGLARYLRAALEP